MFISKKKHNQILKQVSEEYAEKHKKLTEELKEARNLKLILEKLSPLYTVGRSMLVSNNSGGWNLNLPDNVLQYTEDILGGKVIKQEGTKCLVVDKKGNVKTGLTKQTADKGYEYKLVRE